MLALCLGCAPSVWKDLESARATVGSRPIIVIAANDAGVAYEGHLDGWASLHPEKFEIWRELRAVRGLNQDCRAILYPSRRAIRGAEQLPQRWYGSSGLYAAQAAIDVMGCTGAILCGVPLDEAAGHIARPGRWADAERYRRGFYEAKAEGAPIRSMSGWTASVLGVPDGEWLRRLEAT